MVPAGRSLDLTLVLEYVDQDLSTYLSKVPASGLSYDVIKVIFFYDMQETSGKKQSSKTSSLTDSSDVHLCCFFSK